jgi:NADH-quinone oxidoreductase subunit J
MSGIVAAEAVTETNVGETAVFWVCAILAVTGALGLVLSRKAVHSALFVALTMINLAILYVANQAPFLGMVQVVVYTGAVMMLFLFVLMVVGVDSSDSLVETIRGQRLAAILLGLGLGVMLVAGIGNGMSGVTSEGLDIANGANGGNVQGIARLIFTDYILAFEVTSALLITAAMGAMVLAHRERWSPKPTQEELARRRFTTPGMDPGPLPSPGVYARHNAVDTPALLPDGTAAPMSVPGPLSARHDVRPVDIAAEYEVDEIAEGASVIAPEGHPVAPDPEGGAR